MQYRQWLEKVWIPRYSHGGGPCFFASYSGDEIRADYGYG
jgi:hypothetical protein